MKGPSLIINLQTYCFFFNLVIIFPSEDTSSYNIGKYSIQFHQLLLQEFCSVFLEEVFLFFQRKLLGRRNAFHKQKLLSYQEIHHVNNGQSRTRDRKEDYTVSLIKITFGEPFYLYFIEALFSHAFQFLSEIMIS